MSKPEPVVILHESDFEIGHTYDAGRSGKTNEDMYGIFPIRHNSPDPNIGVLDVQVAVVADGIGGSAGGEVASYLAVTEIQQSLYGSEQEPEIKNRLLNAILTANRRIYQEAQTQRTLEGMGSTVVVAAVAFGQLYVMHAGDSRAYLLRNGKIHLLTQDHSWVQEAVEAGRLTPTEAERHPSRNVIRRFLGGEATVDVDTQIVDIHRGNGGKPGRQPMLDSMRLQPGDTILLCSDGLNDVVSDQDLERVLDSSPPKGAAEKLVRMANAAGGPDNITAVVLRWAANAPAPVAAAEGRKWWLYAIPVLVVLLLGATAAFAGWIPGIDSNRNGSVPSEEQASVATATSVALAGEIATATSTEVPTSTWTPTAEPSATAKPTETVIPTLTPVVAVAIEPTTQASETPSPIPTVANTATTIPTNTPTQRPTRTPTTAPTPTSTPTTFATSTPAVVPTATPRPLPTPTPTRRPGVTSTATVSTPGGNGGSVTPDGPSSGTNSDGRVLFKWRSTYNLKSDEAFELIFWKAGEDPSVAGRGVASGPTRDSQISVDFSHHDWVVPGSYLWGIRLVRTEPTYQSLRYLGGGWEFTRSSGASTQPTAVPTATLIPTDTPIPTATSARP